MKQKKVLELRFSKVYPEVHLKKIYETGYFTMMINTNDEGFFNELKSRIEESLEEGYKVEWIKN